MRTGAQAALRGYRLQALYTLDRLLAATDDHIFHLEGHEDLDIFDSEGQLVEVIQVKAYDRELSLSMLKPQSSESFFRRVLSRRVMYPDANEFVVSLGPVTSSFADAFRGAEPARGKAIKQFCEWGYSSQEAETILERVRLVLDDQARMEAEVYAKLKDALPGMGYDPEAAFNLLHAWMFQAAERRERITRAEAIRRLTKVGEFLAKRDAHHEVWFSAVVPLSDEVVGLPVDMLKEEFRHGTSASYSHIVAGVDVRRPKLLDQIGQGFQKGRVVILRGASGQGKSTLAYRYLHDEAVSSWRFEIRPLLDRQQSFLVARAILGHLDAIGAPAYILLNVQPGDTNWPELVRDLASHQAARVLVTIREEDWVRATGVRTSFSFTEVEVTLEESDARQIYSGLSETIQSPLVLDFDEAWERFGGKGPLLEFAYLLTQRETLEARLQLQVDFLHDEVRAGRLQPVELQLLRLVSIASEFGGRLDLGAVQRALSLLAPSRTLSLFEKEYLLRVSNDGSLLEGLHPVRSAILVKLLTDPLFASWSELATEVLPFLAEEDLEAFLLFAFSRHPEARAGLQEALTRLPVKTWDGAGSVTRALIWLGLAQYREANEEVFKEAQEAFGDAWYLALMVDVGKVGVLSPEIVRPPFDDMEWLPIDRDRLKAIRGRLSSTSDIYAEVNAWLSCLPARLSAPVRPEAWSNFAETVYWGTLLDVGNLPLEGVLDDLWSVIHEISLDTAADVVFALSMRPESDPKILEELRTILLSRFQHDAEVSCVEFDGSAVRSHFIAVFDDDTQMLNAKEIIPNRAHVEAVWEAGFLRRLYPDRETFGTIGYGHIHPLLPSDHDDTIKAISRKSLPVGWSTHLNGRFANLEEYYNRPATWAHHADLVLRARWAVVKVVEAINQAIERYYQSSGPTILLDDALRTCFEEADSLLGKRLRLPRTAVDEWGLTGEGNNMAKHPYEQHTGRFSVSHFSLSRHSRYIDPMGKYFSEVRSFLGQAFPVVAFRPLIEGLSDPIARERAQHLLSESGAKEPNIALSVVLLANAKDALFPAQSAFREHLSGLVLSEELERLEKQEQNAFGRLKQAWLMFRHRPRKRKIANVRAMLEDYYERSVSQVRRSLKDKLRSLEEGVSVRFLRSPAGDPATQGLWIALDLADPPRKHEAIQQFVSLAREALSGDDHVLDVLMLEVPTLNVVPLYRGHAFKPEAWRLKTLLLVGRPEMGLWNFIPNEVGPAVWSALRFPVISHPRLSWGIKLHAQCALVCFLVSRASVVSAIPVNGDGQEILLKHLAGQQSRLFRALQELWEQYSQLAKYVSSCFGDPTLHRPNLIDIADGLVELQKSLEAVGVSADSDIRDMSGGSEGLMTSLAIAEYLNLIWMTDVLEHPDK